MRQRVRDVYTLRATCEEPHGGQAPHSRGEFNASRHPFYGEAPTVFFLLTVFSLFSTLKNMLALKNSKTCGHLLIVSYLVLYIKFDFFFNFAPWHLIFKSNQVLILLIVVCFFLIFFLDWNCFFYLSTFDFIFFLYQFWYSFFLILFYPFFCQIYLSLFVFSSFIFSLSSISKNMLAL